MADKKIDKILRMTMKSAFIVFFGLVISKILIYVHRIIIARYFGPEIYGVFSIAIMILAWFFTFSTLGLGEGVMRYISFYRGVNNKKRIKEVFQTCLKIVIFMSIITGFIMFLSSKFLAISVFHNPDLIIFFQLFSIAVPIFSISQIFLGTIKAFEKIQWYSFIINILQPVIKVSVLVILIFIGLNSDSIAFSVIFGFIAVFLSSYFVCKYFLFKKFINIKTKQKRKITKELLHYSIPVMFSAVIYSILGWADTFLLGALKTSSDVGIYNAALPIAMLITFVPFLFMQLFFPLINKEYAKKNLSLIRQLTKQVGKWIFIINLPILFIVLFFPGVIINLLFGPQYLGGKIALILLVLGFFISSQIDLCLNLLGMIKKSKLRFFDILFVLALDIILNILLIPKYGLIGAALATLISYFVYAIIVLSQTYYFLKIIPVKKKMLRVFLSVLIAGAISLIMGRFIETTLLNTILLISLFILSYIFLIFITKSLDRNDLMILSTIKNKIKK